MKPLILITNDDGVLSPGLRAAAEAVAELGELLIVAPRFQQTSMSRSFPKGDDIGKIEEVILTINGKQHIAYGVIGSPAQAVSHGLLEIASRKPALCISGINYGENLGTGLSVSGTIGAALEANTYGIPGLAVNLAASIKMQHSSDYDPLDWEVAMFFTKLFASKIIKNGLPPDTALLNINVPSTATPNTPIRLTVQSRQDYFVFEKPPKRDFSKGFRLKVVIKIDEKTLEPDSDIKAFLDGVVSVTPISWDLTARQYWDQLKEFCKID